MKDKVFMTINRRRIWYRITDDGVIYLVARGDGTDEIFTNWSDAMEWIENKKYLKKEKKTI